MFHLRLIKLYVELLILKIQKAWIDSELEMVERQIRSAQ